MNDLNERDIPEYQNLKTHIIGYLIARLILATDGIIVWVPAITFMNGYILLLILYALRFLLYLWMFNEVYKKIDEINILKNSENRFFILFLFFLIPGFFETALILIFFSKSLKNFTELRYCFAASLLGAFLIHRFLSQSVFIAHRVPDFVDYVSVSSNPSVGKSFTLKAPMFILTNLKKKFDANTLNTYVSTSALVEFRQNNPSFLVTGNSRLELLPAGSVIKIIKSYNKVSRGLLFPRFDELFLIKTSSGKVAEIDKAFFEYDVIGADNEKYDYSEQPLMPLIQDFQNHGEKKLTICDDNIYVGDIKLMFIEHRLLSLFKEFNILNEVEIESVANMVDSSRGKKYCAVVNFKTLEPLYLMYFFGEYLRSEFVQNNLHKKFEIENVVKFDQEKAMKMTEDEMLEFNR